MTTIRIKGASARNYFAEKLVQEYGPDGARQRTCGPMRQAVESAIRALKGK